MKNHFIKINSTEAFDDLVARSKERPVVIFKHSLTCPISAAAYDQMSKYDGEVALVEVQRARELSKAIEKQLGVAHESPQVIVMRKGQVTWEASHFAVKVADVSKAVAESR
jgi:bacillithiol system protein YtxJ